MSKRNRLNKIEQRTGGGDHDVIIVCWNENGIPDPGQLVNMGGVKMTYREYERRYPDHETVTVKWDDINYE